MSKKPRNPKSFKNNPVYIPNQDHGSWDDDSGYTKEKKKERDNQKSLSRKKLTKK